jgi:hypothetical protein
MSKVQRPKGPDIAYQATMWWGIKGSGLEFRKTLLKIQELNNSRPDHYGKT